MSDVVDERWDRLGRQTWTCATCHQKHQGLMDLGAAAPYHWQGPPERQSNSAVHDSTHCLTEDFCIIDAQHFFIRCLLELPLVGAAQGECFGFGVWSTLAEKNFRIYVETFDEGGQGSLGPWFGWFSNRLHGYPDTLNLKCHVHPRDERQRPVIELEPSSLHPLARESREGITYERLLEVYAAHGHGPPITPV
jgi:hypothetical protein